MDGPIQNLSEWSPVVWEEAQKIFRETREYGLTVPVDAELRGAVAYGRHVTLEWSATIAGRYFRNATVVCGDEQDVLTGIVPLVIHAAGKLARQCILSRIEFAAEARRRAADEEFEQNVLEKVRAHSFTPEQGERMIEAIRTRIRL